MCRIPASALVGLCFVLGSGAVRAEPLTFYELTFPDSIAGFERGSVADHESRDPGLGYSIGYLGGDAVATLTIYGRGRGEIPDDPADRRVVMHLIENLLAVEEAGRRGLYREVGPVSGLGIDDESGSFRFGCGRFEVVNLKDRRRDSFLCLTTWRGSFLKLRYTTAHRASSEDELRRFAGAWVRRLMP